MPVYEMKPKRSSEHWELVKELAEEWSRKDSGNTEPKIFIERTRDGKLAHVYVIWSKWDGREWGERSEIVMDAAQKALPEQEVLNITIAMGVTPDEARRMGIQA
ncbi:MAG TPA: hypothetical protein VMD30_03755 [Tepidisphaeraceae bacterium]|nr:hypothetical protein [Tepidisphaeraceae bacterium]